MFHAITSLTPDMPAAMSTKLKMHMTKYIHVYISKICDWRWFYYPHPSFFRRWRFDWSACPKSMRIGSMRWCMMWRYWAGRSWVEKLRLYDWRRWWANKCPSSFDSISNLSKLVPTMKTKGGLTSVSASSLFFADRSVRHAPIEYSESYEVQWIGQTC